MKFVTTSASDRPDIASAMEAAAETIGGSAVEAMIDAVGAHPVAGIMMIIDHLSFMLRSMDRDAANDVLQDLAHERKDVVSQRRAVGQLVESYEKAVAEMERAEHGGPLQ